MATDRDYTQHPQANIAPKGDGRTKTRDAHVCRGGENEGYPTHSRAEVRLICPDAFANALLWSAQRLRPKLHGQGPRAEAEAERRLPRSRREQRRERMSGGVPPLILVC